MLTDFRQSVLGRALAASAFVLIAASAAPAAAQSLSLSYNLDPVNAAQLPKAPTIVNRCTGFTWAATLATACIAEVTVARVMSAVAAMRAGAAAHDGASAAPAPTVTTETVGAFAGLEAAPRRLELPTLGTPEARVIRAAGGREDFVGNARSVDVNLRFGSKYRMRSGDEGWEVYKFNDPATESRLQSSNGGGVRQVGVEVLFPFQ